MLVLIFNDFAGLQEKNSTFIKEQNASTYGDVLEIGFGCKAQSKAVILSWSKTSENLN